MAEDDGIAVRGQCMVIDFSVNYYAVLQNNTLNYVRCNIYSGT